MPDPKGRAYLRKKKVPVPSLKREDQMARTLAAEYEKLFGSLRASARDGPVAVLHRLQELVGEGGVDVERLRSRLNAQLVAETRRSIEDLIGRGGRMAEELETMALPAREVFSQKMRYLRELYLDDAVERWRGEEDDLKRAFLGKLTEWAEEGGELEVGSMIDRMEETSARRARFFARDQFAKFNRAVTVAGYQQADVRYYEWLTSNDARVRPPAGKGDGPGEYLGMPLGNHRIRNHRVYTLEELLADPEYQSYNCRCGVAPLWDLTPAQERRRVA